VRDIDAFKREHELVPAEQLDSPTDDPFSPRIEEEPDLRAEDDALVAAALDAEPEESADDESDDSDGDGDDDDKPRRRRGRRGGRGRKGGRGGARKALEGTFDHGDEGYGLWLDPAVQDDPVYAEHWAGHRPVTVTVEQDQIVIRRAGEDGGSADDGDDDAGSAGNEPAPESALDPDEFDA